MASRILQNSPQYPTFHFEASRTVVCCADPVICPSCRKADTIFINREGRTLCSQCGECQRKVRQGRAAVAGR
jgi:hypothetical protein